MAERLLLAGAGNAEKGINAINPRFQAEALRRIRGRDTGVLDNSFYTATSAKGVARTANSNFMWKLSAPNVSDIAVGRGMATAYGYDLQSEQTVHLVGTAATTGTKYIFVYLEWDLHNPDEAYGSINLYDNGSSSSWTPVSQDNLITNPTGIYQMPLYRLTVNTAGTVTATANWTSLGVATIGYPLRSEYANRAEEADHADDATKATDATYAQYAKGKTDKTLANHLTDILTRLDDLGFKKASISITNSNYIDASSEFYQLGKVLYGKWLFKVPSTGRSPSDVATTVIARVSGVILPSENVVLGVRRVETGDSSGYGTLYRQTTYTLTTSGTITVAETFYDELFTTWAAGTYTRIATLDLYQSPNKYFIATP